ncbi:MAG: cryptochrome/photolyase family protein, partial [Luteimonas sp.]
MPNALIWLRNDLRLADNPAVRAAMDTGYAPIFVHIHSPDEEGDWAPGAASDAWRHRSLQALGESLQARGSRLRLFSGPSLPTLQSLAAACDAQAVFWNRRYEPAIEQRDAKIKQALRGQGLRADSFNGALLFEPWEVETKAGGPYKVFTPFWRNASSDWMPREPWDAPLEIDDVEAGPDGVSLDALNLAPARHWDAGFWERWSPGEAGAHEALAVFIDGALHGYRKDRDRPDRVGTSRLSPHLHFGEIAPWRVVAALESVRRAGTTADIDACVRELGWREFAHHLLHHFPQTVDSNLNPRFDHFDWARDDGGRL